MFYVFAFIVTFIIGYFFFNILFSETMWVDSITQVNNSCVIKIKAKKALRKPRVVQEICYKANAKSRWRELWYKQHS